MLIWLRHLLLDVLLASLRKDMSTNLLFGMWGVSTFSQMILLFLFFICMSRLSTEEGALIGLLATHLSLAIESNSEESPHYQDA